MRNMEITKREVIFSIALICVMLIMGIIISDKINDDLMEQYQKYNTALQINDDPELFKYGMRTNIGNAFVHGELAAVDPISYDAVDGVYGSMTKTTERYTMHTRTVTKTRTVNGKSQTYTETEIYWSWDAINKESIHASTISYLGVEFPYGTIDYFPEHYIDTIDLSSNLRDVYYGSEVSYVGTLFANLSDNTISETSFHNDKSIDDTIKSLETKWQLVLFWIVWIIIIGLAVFGFYYLDNRWLE